MNKYKIAILTEQIGTHSGSRAGVELAKHLLPINKSITLYSYKKNVDQEEVKKLKKLKVKIITFTKPILTSRFFPDLNLLKALRYEKPDFAIFCGTLPFFLSAKLANIKTIRIYMGTQFNAYLENKLPNENKNPFDIIANYLTNLYIYINELITVCFSTNIIAISKYAGFELTRLYKRKADRIIYLAGDHLPKLKTKKNLEDKTLNLLTISRITPYKGFHILIEEINKLKNVNLTIVGSAERKKYLKYLQTISSSNIIFKSGSTDHDISTLFTNSDVYVTADRNLFFGFPIAEASFFGKPSIAFSYAAASEIIENNKTGYLVNNRIAFRGAISKYIKNPNLISKMGVLAKSKAEKNFSWSKIAIEYQKLFENL